MTFDKIISDLYDNPDLIRYIKAVAKGEWEEYRQSLFVKLLQKKEKVIQKHSENRLLYYAMAAVRNERINQSNKQKITLVNIENIGIDIEDIEGVFPGLNKAAAKRFIEDLANPDSKTHWDAMLLKAYMKAGGRKELAAQSRISISVITRVKNEYINFLKDKK